MEQTEKKKKRERGAIIVEATISLSIFMFAMFTLLSVTQIAYTQSRMSVALTTATKQLAEYTHVYFATGLNNYMSESGGKSSEFANQVAEFIQNLGGQLGSIDSELGQFVDSAGNALSGDSIAGMIKSGTGQALAIQMMEANLVEGRGDSAEAFMRRNHVQNLDMMESTFLGGTSGDIFMRAKYEIRVVQLLDIDFSFQMSCWAYAQAWQGGESSGQSGGNGSSGGGSGGGGTR